MSAATAHFFDDSAGSSPEALDDDVDDVVFISVILSCLLLVCNVYPKYIYIFDHTVLYLHSFLHMIAYFFAYECIWCVSINVSIYMPMLPHTYTDYIHIYVYIYIYVTV